MYAACVLPLAIIALGAIDLARAVAARGDLQASLDAAALIAARSSAVSDTEIDKVGQAAFGGEFKATTVTVSSTYKNGVDANSVVGSATATIKPIILNLILRSDLKISVDTVVKRGQGSPLELALVLDTTGSMSGTKLSNLKLSAKNLVTKLTSGKSDNVKIGVVPFGQYVNVGVSRRAEPWMSVPADYSETIKPACYVQSTQTSCQTETYACTKTNDGVSTPGTCSRSINCVTKAITPQNICPASYVNNYKFYGCAGSPAYPKNVRDDDPSRIYPGFLNLTCAAELTPLTDKPNAVNKAIDALSANGETYIPSGLAWGFNVLSAAKPLTEAADYDKTGTNKAPRKALVLMTDGENTKLMNAANGRHDRNPAAGQPAAEADTYTAELCANIKAQRIEVFTIAFQVTNTKAKDMLQKCASDDEHYFDATDAAKLDAAFGNIAKALKNIYIAK